MKNQLLSILVLIAMLISAVSCADNNIPPETGASSLSTKTEADVTSTDIYTDDIPDNIDCEGMTVRFISSTGFSGAICDTDGVIGEDIVEEAVWTRNLTVENRLDAKIEVVKEVNWTELQSAITDSLYAFSDDYDVICGVGSTNINLAALGLMYDLNRVEYIDFSKYYWASDMIDSISYGGKSYWATGDISYYYISYLFGAFMNNKVWEDTVATSESRSIFDIVNDGEWTFEKLNTYINISKYDIDGNGTMNYKDRFGLVAQIGTNVMGMYFAAGGSFSERDSDGTVVLNLDKEQNFNIYSRIYEIMKNNDGVYAAVPTVESDTISRNIFTTDRALFYFAHIDVASLDKLRAMQTSYCVIPYPKYDEKQENYHSIHMNSVPLFGIPTTVTADRLNKIGAVLEVMSSESYKSVYPVYYEEALKVKYSRDDGSAKMLDLIRDNVICDFAYMWGENITGSPTLLELIWVAMQSSNPNLASIYASNKDSYELTLEALCETLEDN